MDTAVVEVEVMIQDNDLAETRIGGGGEITETLHLAAEDFYLDGPVSRRVAVLDFDPESGALLPGAPYTAPRPGRQRGKFTTEGPASADAEARRMFILANVYGLVVRTIELYERDDVLGRRVRWAFDGPQILVVPRAGKAENAYYERESRSLQFFFFESSTVAGRTIYTSMSRDIVAHETAHAILDGIVPDLYGAASPQCLALHEAIADLTAIHMALRSQRLREEVLESTGWTLSRSSAFASIAEEFGRGRGQGSLRDLSHDKTMGDVPGREPHDLSEVLSGAMWSLLCTMFAAETADADGHGHETEERKRVRVGRTLGILTERFRRITLRALDLLPPGEVSFADYGRAIIASDQMSNPLTGEVRGWLKEEFVKRQIVADPTELDVPDPFDHDAVAAANLDLLETSDFEAYRFVEDNRNLFHADEGVPFTVRPRLRTRKRLYLGGDEDEWTDDLLIKVSWDREEANLVERGLPPRRRYTVGTTLVINRKTRRVGAVLTSRDVDDMKDERDMLLAGLCEAGDLKIGPATSQLPYAVGTEVDGDVMRLRGTAAALHLMNHG